MLIKKPNSAARIWLDHSKSAGKMKPIDRKAHKKTEQDVYTDEKGGCGSMLPSRLSDDELASTAFLAKSLSDANRLRILLLLKHGKRSVSAIVDELGLSQALVSHHLKELKRSLLVTVERRGPFIYYALSDQRVLDVIETINAIAEKLLAARKTF